MNKNYILTKISAVIFFIVLGVFVFRVGGPGYIPLEKTVITQPEKLDEASLLRRETILNDWLNALNSVNYTPSVTNVIDMLNEKAGPAIPTEKGLKVLNSERPIRIVVLLPEDAKYPAWKEILDEKVAGAYFLPEVQAIVLKNADSLGEKSKGMLLAHEGSHALHYLEKPYGTDIPQIQFCREERNTHASENELLLAVGGKPYTDFLQKNIEYMAKNLQKNANGVALPMPDKTYLALEKIFGPWKSDRESSFWVAGVWVDTMFHFVDKYADATQPQKDEMKAEALCSLYQHLGILLTKVQ